MPTYHPDVKPRIIHNNTLGLLFVSKGVHAEAFEILMANATFHLKLETLTPGLIKREYKTIPEGYICKKMKNVFIQSSVADISPPFENLSRTQKRFHIHQSSLSAFVPTEIDGDTFRIAFNDVVQIVGAMSPNPFYHDMQHLASFKNVIVQTSFRIEPNDIMFTLIHFEDPLIGSEDEAYAMLTRKYGSWLETMAAQLSPFLGQAELEMADPKGPGFKEWTAIFHPRRYLSKQIGEKNKSQE